MPSRQSRARNRPKLPRKRPGQAGGPRDLNRRENVRRLCDAALLLFLADGTAAVTVDQIVDRAGMAKGSFYRYVTDKAQLVALIMAPVASEVAAALDRCETALGGARADELAAIYLRLAVELSDATSRHAGCVLLYLQEARAPAGGARDAIHELAEHITARAIALTEVAHRHGLIRDVDPRTAALTVTGAIDAMLFAHLRRSRFVPAEVATATRELVSIVLRGVRG